MVNYWIIGGIVVVLGYVGLAYNSLVRKRNQVRNSWAQIDVQLKRRNDLIPNLVKTVKGYMKHEKGVLEAVTKARTSMMNAGSNVGNVAQADNMLTGALKSLFAVAENYPDLKASKNFIQLQEEITGTENKVAYSRQNYNDSVMFMNNKIETFPSNLIAKTFSFKEETLFEVAEGEKAVPKIEF